MTYRVFSVEAPADLYESDKPREACGVVAVYSTCGNAVRLVHSGLQDLQPRGQDSSGITAADDGSNLVTFKGLGLVETVYNGGSILETVLPIGAEIAIGHNRWGTMPSVSDKLRVAQPLYNHDRTFSIGHNGHISNIDDVMTMYGFSPEYYASDSEGLMLLIDKHMAYAQCGLAEAIQNILPILEGAISITATDGHCIVGARDPMGFRPLTLGRLPNGFALASETTALEAMGATFEEEVLPGQMVVIDSSGITKISIVAPQEAACFYEYVYFSHPDNIFGGQRVGDVRRRLGVETAREHPINAHMVIGVPRSGLLGAEGYTQESGLPLVNAITRNPDAPRTFTLTNQEERKKAAERKYIVSPDDVRGKSIVIVDDSIIRGTTFPVLVAQLRAAGAVEIHVRIPAPPYKFPCFYGMDTSNVGDLFAARFTKEEMRSFLEVDSLEFLSTEGARRAVARPLGATCMACSTGEYPTPVTLTTKVTV